MEGIKNVFCVGRNYPAHVAELKNEQPTEPVWFMKPTHSLVVCDEEMEIVLPTHLGEVHYEIELVVQLEKDYLPDQSLEKLVGKVALGVDFTLRDLQSDLKVKSLPWLRAKGFKNSGVLTKGIPFSSLASLPGTTFHLNKNDELVQRGEVNQMLFSLDELLLSCWEQFDLREGDIVYTGTPAGVGPVKKGDKFELYLNEGCLGSFVVD